MFRPSWRPSTGCITKEDTNTNAIMDRRCRDLETLTCVEKFQIRLKYVKLWSGELDVVDCEPAVSGWPTKEAVPRST
jgi:hypothetical protein